MVATPLFKVFTLKRFDREKECLQKDEQEQIEKLFLQLKENPYVGDSIRFRFFREKRIKGKRVYYLVYDDLLSVLLVGISDKKSQKETIDRIIRYLGEYRKLMRDLTMED